MEANLYLPFGRIWISGYDAFEESVCVSLHFSASFYVNYLDLLATQYFGKVLKSICTGHGLGAA